MASSHFAGTTRRLQPKAQSPPTDVVSPQPTYDEFIDIFNEALGDAARDYSYLPRLRDKLQAQYHEGEEACKLGERTSIEILSQSLRIERLLFDAFNKHRLGGALWKYYKGHEVPENAAELLATLGDDIDEDLESFPLRCQVVTHGFPSLTENLPPIYQTVNHAAKLTQDQDQMLKTPVTQSKTRSKGKAPASGATPLTKGKKTGRSVENYDKLLGAPAPNLDFPVGNITMCEISAYHPEGIKSWDMIDRLCGSGGSQASYAAMINHFRVMDRGPIGNNSVYRMLKASMNKRAKVEPKYNGWTSGVHDDYGNPDGFDSSSVSVTGFRTPADGKVTFSAPPMPIKDMANGVKIHPAGYDALDLTRAVQYCVSHPDEVWMYPTDYERLVNHIGPASVQPGHQDNAAISRYTPARTVTGSRTTSSRKRPANRRARKSDADEEEELAMDTGSDDSDSDVDFDSLDSLDNKGKERKSIFDDSGSDGFDTPSRKPAQKRRKIALKPRAPRATTKRALAPSHLRKEVVPEEVDSESDGEAYQGPKKMKAAEVRRSGRATKVTQSYVVHPEDVRGEEEDQVSSSSLSELDSDMRDADDSEAEN